MSRYGMTIDLDRCSGCQNCVVACTQENNVPGGNDHDGEMGRLIRWIQLLPRVEGTYPELEGEVTPMMCQHCDRSPCTMVCPVHATYNNTEGFVAQVYWRCIGCRYCVNACPYTVKFFNWREPQFESKNLEQINPSVSVRSKGVTEKCSFCQHRLAEAKEQAAAEGRPVKNEDYVPACVESCPTEAIIFGDLENEELKVVKAARSKRAGKILEELGTHPKVTYLKHKDIQA